MNRVVGRDRSRVLRVPDVWRLGRFFWDVFWLPFWLGSTLPPPALPGRRGREPQLAGRTPAILRQLDQLRTAIHRQRTGILVARSAWLALAVLDAGLILQVLAHRDVAWRLVVPAAVAVLVGGLALAVTARPSRTQLARTLDRSFGLRERVSTALEGAHGGRLTGLRALQIVEATRVTGKLGQARAFQRRLPLRELILIGIFGLLLIVLLLAALLQGAGLSGSRAGAGAGRGNAPGLGRGEGAARQPGANGEPQAGQNGQGQKGQGSQPGQNAPGTGQPSASDQRDLNAVADALQQHPATRQSGQALAQGDYQGAGQKLREAGQNAGKRSPEERQALAGDLRQAADQLSDPQGQLAQDLRAAADALEKPGAAGAQAAFNDLASDIERAGQGQSPNQAPGQSGSASSPPPRQQPGGSPGNAPPGPGGGDQPGTSPQLPGDQKPQPAPGVSTPLLGADGKPIELPKGDQTGPLIPSQGQGNRGGSPQQPLPGSAGTGEGQLRQSAVGEAGSDLNGVPDDQREAVERYFTPRANPE